MARVMTMGGPESLVGEELSAVAFVRDYVEFHFDGPILRALADPLVRAEGNQSQFPALGSRDALCSLIGQTVESVRVVWSEDSPGANERIEFAFRDATVVIPLGPERRDGPEAAHFIPSRPDGSLILERMHVW